MVKPLRRLLGSCALALTLLGGPALAAAQDAIDLAPDAAAYALVVGSNASGPGQEPLEFAERDAERMANVLIELGSYQEDRVDVLRSPSRAQMSGALRRLRQRLAAHRARDEQTVVFFYYSGHAQSQALRLGAEEFPLVDLRDAIEALPSTLTFVVLDACQSGAYSRVRGAEAVADFSQNSVQQLQTRGVAVLASSSGDELSQESERLEAGYFTHHLLVALRGAADEDHDGRVALDEAYRYAYAETLRDTSQTAVGGQHVTLETELTGHGAVALTYPARASAQLELPASIEGHLLITRARGHAVVAELTKARGVELRIALPPGRYEVIWRDDDEIRSCGVSLPARGTRTLTLTECHEIDEDEATARAEGTYVENPWGIEVGAGVGLIGRSSDYTDRLAAFGYQRDWFWLKWQAHVQAALERRITRRASVLLSFESFEREHYEHVAGETGDAWPFTRDAGDKFEWSVWTVGLQVRGTYPLHGDWFFAYVQAGGGLGIARTVFDSVSPQDPITRVTQFGPFLTAGLGLRFVPWRHFGFYLQANFAYVPVLRNDLGDRHDSGGPSFVTGFRIQL